ncbi:MAG: (E)-4-hydroxy-3-methylbut-2-enyl-diphosphate synthase [Puniceicoccales bacterium]|jgi:1-hydroxy-2-methyl-2-(E)-butenyl 4-diphosphate synthase|nr:(E)-4-hydroxy-3-methylbut-2-enyl-diphosphate synthase [Puniceicoccales bacterium]
MEQPPRRVSGTVTVGRQKIGGAEPIAIQSMLSVPLSSESQCLRQIEELLWAGCFLVRVAIPTARSLFDFERIRRSIGCENAAFIADLHFNGELALDALDVFEKVRINPGNFAGTLSGTLTRGENFFRREEEEVRTKAREFFRKAKRLGRAVRIGCNGGSISARIRSQCGGGDGAMVSSAEEMVRWALEENFEDLVLSFKCSSASKTIEVNRLARKRMDELHCPFPFHLGVTEAGKGFCGRAAAAVAVGVLLSEGLGDTVRISLTESPGAEVKFAKKLLKFCESSGMPSPIDRPEPVRLIGDETCGGDAIARRVDGQFDGEDYLLHMAGALLGTKNLRAVVLEAGPHLEERREIVESILQVCRWGKFFTEIISCPTCGRTGYDVGAVADEVRRRLGSYPHLRIAVMGCSVNGVGEMGDAHYGCVGCGRGMVQLYRGGKRVGQAVPQEMAAAALESLLKDAGEEAASET